MRNVLIIFSCCEISEFIQSAMIWANRKQAGFWRVFLLLRIFHYVAPSKGWCTHSFFKRSGTWKTSTHSTVKWHSTQSAAVRDGLYPRKRVIFAYLVHKIYILKNKCNSGCRTVTASWVSATQNARKMDVRCRNVAWGMCAAPHLTCTIPDRKTRLKTDVCTGPN
jgi:hypothetical protein